MTTWLTIDVERILEVDKGRDVILVDRWQRCGGTVVLQLSKASVDRLLNTISERDSTAREMEQG